MVSTATRVALLDQARPSTSMKVDLLTRDTADAEAKGSTV
jgi:hypothetical protein